MRSIVTDQVAWSIGRSVTLMSPVKTAEPIEMPFGLRTPVGIGNHVLHGGPDAPWEGTILMVKGRPIVKYRDTLRSSVQQRLNRSRCRLGCGLGAPKESSVRWESRSPIGRGNFGEWSAHCKV